MTIDEKLSAIRDIIQFDIGERGLARDPERNLVNAFPGDFANACRSIAEHPSPSVAIFTGFWIADAKCGETDGPLGAVYLARAFQNLGIPSVVVTDFFCMKPLEAGLDVSDLTPKIDVQTIPPARHPWDVFGKLDWTSNVLWRKLTHVIAIERVGPAQDDRCYSMRGRDITEFMCPAHLLVEDAPMRNPQITTIGIGDGGNEIGMGKIPVETIERNIPNGRQIACRVPTDHLIVAGISNWGAYALAAGVALVRGQQLDPSLFDPERERQILRRMVEDGPLVDGKTAQRTVTVDGVSFEEYIRPLVKIREIVEDRL
jgi:D-glutamate cyclase